MAFTVDRRAVVAAVPDWTFDGTWPREPKWLDSPDGRMHYNDESRAVAGRSVMVHGNPTPRIATLAISSERSPVPLRVGTMCPADAGDALAKDERQKRGVWTRSLPLTQSKRQPAEPRRRHVVEAYGHCLSAGDISHPR